MYALVPIGGSQPNLRQSSVTKSYAVPAQEQLGRQMPHFSDLAKELAWPCFQKTYYSLFTEILGKHSAEHVFSV